VRQVRIDLIERILRYGVSGCAVAVLFSLGVVALVHLVPAVRPVGASMIAFCLVQPIGYAVHRTISYPDAGLEPDTTANRRLRFVATNLGGFVIAVGGMAVVTEVFHESYLCGIVLNWVLIPGMNFVVYLYWVFRVRSWSRRELV
jgi:putative flippase GtrA